MCCDMLGVVGSHLTIFKLAPTTPNISQHIAKHTQMVRPLNNVAMMMMMMMNDDEGLYFDMLRCHVASRLAGALDRESINNFFILLFCICIKWQV